MRYPTRWSSYPIVFIPVTVGNLRMQSFSEWRESKVLESLRTREASRITAGAVGINIYAVAAMQGQPTAGI